MKKILIYTLILLLGLLLLKFPNDVCSYENNSISNYSQNYEIISLRDKYTKHFRLSDGSYRAIIYGFPIHELDSHGNYIDLYSFDYEGFNNNPDIDPLLLSSDDNIIVNRDDIGLYDTYISSINPNTNYGLSFAISLSNNNTEIGFIKSLTSSIPSDATITTSQIRFLYYYIKSNNNYMDIGAYEILSNWNESTVTWNSNTSISSVCESTFRTLGTATISNSLYATLDISDSVKAWYSGERNNYGIAIKYESGSANNLQIRTRENLNYHTTLIVNYTIGLNINNGTYFIRNGHLEKYVQIDDGDSNNNYNTEGAILELWTGTGVSFQKWIFEYLHNGYYKIISYRSGKVISVQSGYENTGNHALRQETYNGSFRQQWSITLTPFGMYKIKPRSSEAYSTDWVMCCGEGIGGNGRNVEQREYSSNTIYKDEWIIESTEYDARLLAIKEGGVIRDEYFPASANLLSSYLTTDIQRYAYEEISDDLMIHYLENCSFYVIHTHGQQNGIKLSSSNCLIMSELSSADLSDLEFALLLTCNTGLGGYDSTRVANNNPYNFVEQMICCGAETVIGFSDNTSVVDCNKFVIDFLELTLEYGYSVSEAIEEIDYSTYSSNFYSIIVIGGNTNKSFN